MANILVTGATGNVGTETLKWLSAGGTADTIVAGVRDVERAKALFRPYPRVACTAFDFADAGGFDAALRGIDRVFLLRPPQLARVDLYFKPFIAAARKAGIREIVFLSVQGAEKSRLIPHNKIERLILEAGMEYVFLRPGYFMQNLTTTLLSDIRGKRAIVLPAGRAKFNWIDVGNIGEAAAIALTRFREYRGGVLELTGPENLDFYTVASLLTAGAETPIAYRDLDPARFYLAKKREGLDRGMIAVLIMLHYLQRFQSEPRLSEAYRNLTGKAPSTLVDFIARNRAVFRT